MGEFVGRGPLVCKNRLYSHPQMEFEKLMPVTRYKTACGRGFGLAACPTLGLLVTSDYTNSTLSVWSLPGGAGVPGDAGARGASGLARMSTLGGEGSPAPMQFKFVLNGHTSGYLAFTPPPPDSDTRRFPHVLLVADAGHDAVHLVDVRNTGTHVGYLAAPGTIAGPRSVASSGTGSLVAVSAWKDRFRGHHVVHIYRMGSGGSDWTHVRVIGRGFGDSNGQLQRPYGLRFSADASTVCVADIGNDRASMFRVDDGGFVRHFVTGNLSIPYDVEKVEGGWVMACWGVHAVEFVSDGGGRRPFLGKAGGGISGMGRKDGEFSNPTALALVPGLGLIVREFDRLQVFSTPDILAMQCMSASRVGWMTATYRAVIKRQSFMVARRILEWN